jgi:hypothetical protein
VDKLLYFPTITIPKSQWLMGALFYWDKVGSIVPLEYLDRPMKFSRHMRELVHAELIEQIVPEEHIGTIRNYEEVFLNFIDNDSTINHISELGKLGLIGPNGIIKSTTKIHMGKLNNLGEELLRRGLATKRQGSWYLIESYTASNYMTYLATILGSITKYTPITDNYNDLSNLLPFSNKQDTKNALKEQLKARIIEKILPIPISIEDPYDIYRFKEKYNDNLKRFRNYIEEFILNLETFPNHQVEDRIKIFTETSIDEINLIRDRMQSFKWTTIGLATLCSITSPAISLISGVSEANPLDITSASIGLLGAVSIALSGEKLLDINCKPLAYGAIIEREFYRQSTRRNHLLNPR